MVNELKEKIGRPFVKNRFGARQTVRLEEVRRNKVVVKEEGRKDGFMLTLAEFQKFYQEQ